MDAYVKSAYNRGIATLEFFHPKGNSLPSALLSSLVNEVAAAGADDRVKVILLRSAGEKAFCSGASFDEMAAIQNEQQGRDFFNGFARLINAMRTCPKMIVARIQGKCVGGGVGLAAAADYTFASVSSDIKLSELAIGIGPFVVGPAIERKIGLSAFSALALEARQWRNAQWAFERGLFQAVYEAPDTLEAALYELLDALAHSSSQAMAALKKVLWSGTAHWDRLLEERAAISGQLLLRPEAQAAIASFRQA